jgi:hypothetical protein
MLDKTDKREVVLRPVDKEAPAIFVRMTSQIGPNNTIEMSFGIPLDMRPNDLNAYLDKVAACAERQNNKGMVTEFKLRLHEAWKQIETINTNEAQLQAKAQADYELSGRRGEWKPTGSQAAELKNFSTNRANFRDNIIPRLEKEIAALEAKIAQGD